MSGQSKFNSATVKILDGAVIVHMLAPQISNTFQDYFEKEFLPYVKQALKSVERLDIVWDTYTEQSIKQQARNQRGAGEMN